MGATHLSRVALAAFSTAAACTLPFNFAVLFSRRHGRAVRSQPSRAKSKDSLVTRRRRPRSGGYYGGSSSSGNTGATSATPAPIGANQPPTPQGSSRWYKVDLHTHTPASNDYEEPRISYLDWLRMAAERGLDIVAITDHNTVAGVAAIRREIEWLTRLEQQNRLNDEERSALSAWRDLSNRVLVLPGFEFTATFGFHILGLFPPETSVRTLEHILLSLKVPPDKIDIGSTETGSTTDVLTAYRLIHEAGGLAIAAHANSTHGVAMRNFPFGGQTKIAYTQDVNLDALEVTDLEHRGYSTARFFDGSKTEYARRMHSLQGSDAHRLTMDPRNPKRLGIGERATEVFLEEASFEALATLLRSTAWEHVRPARPKERPFDALAVARAAGPSVVQSFHASATKAGGNADAILADICAFANTQGGALYVGVSLRRDDPQGLARPNQVEQQILEAVGDRIAPSLVVRSEIIKSDNISYLRLQVPKGDERPHAVDGAQIWIRDDKRTRAATRDEIVALVLDVVEQQGMPQPIQPEMQADVVVDALIDANPAASPAASSNGSAAEPGAKPKARRSRRGGSRSGTRKVPTIEGATLAAPEAEAAGALQVSANVATEPHAAELPEMQITPPAELGSVETAAAAEPAPEAAPKPASRRGRTRKAPVAEAVVAPVAPAADLPPAVASADTAPVVPNEPENVVTPPTSQRKYASRTKRATAENPVVAQPAESEAAAAQPAKQGTRKPKTTAAPTPVETTTPPPTEAIQSQASAAQPAKPASRKPAARSKKATAPKPVEVPLPQIGVEIVESEERGGAWHHSIRDMRNSSIIKGVTRRGARDLWNYAIRAVEEKRFDVDHADWVGDIGLLNVEKRAGKMRYDLVMRTPEGTRIFYGVTEDGMAGPWAAFIVTEDEE